MNNRFFDGRDDLVDFQALMVGLSVSLSIPTPAMVRAATRGLFTGPAAVVQVGGVTIHGDNHAQVLYSSDSLAALHGSLAAWSARLPVDVHDQYEATRTEMERRFTEAADKRLGKGNLL